MIDAPAGSYRRAALFHLSIMLLIAVLVVLNAVTSDDVADTLPDAQSADAEPSGRAPSAIGEPPRKRSRVAARVHPEPPPSGTDADDQSATATARDESGDPLPGSPPPYTSDDGTVPYYVIVTISSDGARALGSCLPDHEGRFALPPGARSGRVRFVAIRQGARRTGIWSELHSPEIDAESLDGGNVVFTRVEPIGSVEIRTVDDTGVGHAARVIVERRLGSEWYTRNEIDTDEGGEAVIDKLRPGDFRVRMVASSTRSSPLWAPPERSFTVSSADRARVMFELRRPARVAVSVVDERGRPIEGALVYLLVRGPRGMRSQPGGRTDGDGHLAFGGIDPTDVAIVVNKLGLPPVIVERSLLPGLHAERVTLVPGGHTLKGRFTGRPDGARSGLHVLRLADATHGAFVVQGVQVAADGAFSVPGLPSGRYQLAMYRADLARAAFWADIDGRSLDVGDIDVSGAFEQGDRSFEVVVETDDGARGAGPSIAYRRRDWTPGVWRLSQTFFHSRFTGAGVQHVSPGTYEVRVTTQVGDLAMWDLTATATVELLPEGDPPRVVLRVDRR